MFSILLPSRGRPDELLVALDSLDLKKLDKEALIWLDTDDPKLQQYYESLKNYPNVKVFVNERVGYKNGHVMLNFLAEQAKYDWYLFFNDDAYMDNPDWSEILKEFVKQFDPTTEPIALNIWGQGAKANLFPIVSRKFVDICGHFSMGTANDDWIRVVSMRANVCYHLYGIKPKHRKYGQDEKKGNLEDETYQDAEAARAEHGHEWNVRRGPTRHILNEDARKIIDYNSQNRPRMSVLVPSRGRPDILKFSLDSLGLEENILQALVWLDEDDKQLSKYQELFADYKQVKLFVKPRVGYKNYHSMINYLAAHTSIDWLFLWNDDAYMDNSEWFEVFNQHASLIDPRNEPVVFNIWDQGSSYTPFPIISRKYYELLAHIAPTAYSSMYVSRVSHYAKIQRAIFGIKPRHRNYGQDEKMGDINDETKKDIEALRQKSKYLGFLSKGMSQKRNEDVEKILQFTQKRHAGFIGLGKLGLPVALAMEARGNRLIGYDVNPDTADYLRQKKVPFREAHIEKLLADHQLELVDSIEDMVGKTDLIFCAVQTPHDSRFEGDKPLPKDRADFDYSYLKNAISDIVAAADKLGRKINLVVISTCLPGTYQREIKPLLSGNVNYIYNPYFIAMGTVAEDFYNPEFVLIGKDSGDITPLQNFYKLTLGNQKEFVTDITTAEGIKVFYNTFITAKTVLGNMYGEFAHKLGMNVDHIHQALSLATDRLMSPKYLKAGVGDGGGCFPPGELVMTKQGMRPIETIEPGDEVLTSDGTFQKVVKRWEREYDGDLVVVQVRGLPKVRMTVDHPVLVRRDGRMRVPDGRRNTFHKIIDQLGLTEEVRAEALTLDSLIGWPKIEYSVPSGLGLKFLRLAGWYLSEGSAELSSRRGRLRFDMHEREIEDAEDISSLVTRFSHAKSNQRGSTAVVTNTVVGNRRSVRYGNIGLVRELVEQFGKGASAKKIPERILWGSEEEIKAILWGLIRGDGHRGERGISFSTISQNLAWGVFIILHRLGLNPTLRAVPPRGIHKRAFEVRVRNRRLASKLCRIVGWEPYDYDKDIQTYADDRKTIWRHVQKFSREKYRGIVYNLWVEGNHTYVVACGAVHNCHPRDNIALAHLADKYNLSFNIFEQLMAAREKHMEWLGQLLEEEVSESGLPAVILGKSFKPESNIETGSSAILLANLLKNKGLEFDHYEFDHPPKLGKAVYLIATNHQSYANLSFPEGSTVIDPFRFIPKQTGVKLIPIGLKKA